MTVLFKQQLRSRKNVSLSTSCMTSGNSPLNHLWHAGRGGAGQRFQIGATAVSNQSQDPKEVQTRTQKTPFPKSEEFHTFIWKSSHPDSVRIPSHKRNTHLKIEEYTNTTGKLTSLSYGPKLPTLYDYLITNLNITNSRREREREKENKAGLVITLVGL